MTPQKPLEDRIKRLEARAELQDLAVAYFHASDDDDYAVLADCFTQDGAFAASGFSSQSGRGSVVDMLRSARAGMGQTVHTFNSQLLTFEDEDSASGIVAAHLELGIGNQTFYAAVRYIDRYRREGGHWRIAKREMKVIHVGPWSDVNSSLTAPLNVRWPAAEPQLSDYPKAEHEPGLARSCTTRSGA